ncbi:MAG TPA: GTPase domain-containing protein [Candidatus Tectomicrobia bacterium]|nr:GTPase domain-containing protein [Candidatus Tectomicrobia bacterium]
MNGGLARQEAAAALERLLACLIAPRALMLRTEDRFALEQAVERARAQLLGVPEPVLTVALAGGTGAGKSALINALAGSAIAETSPIRPTTTTIRVYHHHAVASGGLPVELAADAVFVPHDRAELRSKVIVDTPDLDSYATQHRAATRALLKAAGLVLYVFSPQNYRDERTWSVLHAEKRFSACAAVLNKADLVTPDELGQITEDLRRSFARVGLPDIRIFRTVAIAHVSGEHTAPPRRAVHSDDMAALRAFLERELDTSEVAQMLRRQRGRVLAHMRDEVDRVAPQAILGQLDAVAAALSERIEAAAARLHEALTDRLALVQAELLPLATLRQHQRFWGPFRTWLGLTDFFRFGLTGVVHRLLDRSPRVGAGLAEPLLVSGPSTAVDDLLRAEAHALQNLLYARQLPVERWRMLTVQTDGARLMAEVAAALEARFEAAAVVSAHRRGVIVWLASALGSVVPTAFVGIGLYTMGRDLLAGNYIGLPLLGHLLAMLILAFLVLQGFVGAFLPSERRWLGPEVGHQVIRQVLTQTMGGWIGAYRADLEADLADLHEPLAALEAAMTPD